MNVARIGGDRYHAACTVLWPCPDDHRLVINFTNKPVIVDRAPILLSTTTLQDSVWT